MKLLRLNTQAFKLPLASLLFALFFLFAQQHVQAQSPLIIGTYKAKVNPDQNVCVKIYGREFEQILSMQYSLRWDTEQLKFKNISNFGLPKLSAQNFGTQRAEEGILTFAWYDPNLQGISKADGSILYEVCFEVVGAKGTSTKLEFANEPTIIEVSKAPGTLIELQTEGGKVEILE
ncbi:MAG: cohesin domain-containing protein [Bacteroidota bacterium]